MDWLSVAGLLAERGTRPVVLLDRAGRIRLFNAAMEQVLGWRRYEVEGRPFGDACAPPARVQATRRWLAQALRGALREYELDVLTREGRHLLLRAELALVGRGRDQGLLVTVLSSRPADGLPELEPGQDLDYQIAHDALAFGTLREIACLGRPRQSLADQAVTCFQLLHQRSSPCDDCPVLRSVPEAWPRIAIRRPDARARLEVITAELAGPQLVQIKVRIIADQTLTVAHDAKIRALADKAGLSERERSVFGYLLLGRSLDDIAGLLQLSRNTVKFHQGNILQKLGADSRIDLIRLTGF